MYAEETWGYTEFCGGNFFQVSGFKFVWDPQSFPLVVHTGRPEFDPWRVLPGFLGFILLLDEPGESLLVV